MKRMLVRIGTLLLVLLLALSAVACSDTEVPDGMQLVSGEEEKFDLFVPAMWTPMQNPPGAYVSSADRSNVTVTSHFPDTVMSASEYWTQKCLPEYTNVLENFSVVEERCEDTTLGGRDAKLYVFVYTISDTAYESMQIITVQSDIIYTLTYTATSAAFEDHLDDVESIRAEFRFR